MFVQEFQQIVQLPFKSYYISGIRVPWVLSFKKATRSNILGCHVTGRSRHSQTTQELCTQLCLFIYMVTLMETRRLEVDRSHNSLIVDHIAQELEVSVLCSKHTIIVLYCTAQRSSQLYFLDIVLTCILFS